MGLLGLVRIGCLEPFLPLWEHFCATQLYQYTPDLLPRLKGIVEIFLILTIYSCWILSSFAIVTKCAVMSISNSF